MKRFVLIVLISGLVPLLHADAKPPLPPGPLLDKAPEFAQWTITSITSGPLVGPNQPESSPKSTKHSSTGPMSQSGKDQPADRSTIVTKTKSIRFEETTNKAGAKIQRWCMPDMQVTIQKSSAPIVAIAGNTRGTFAYIDYAKTDFTGFEWISPSNFKGIEKVMGHDCLVFHDKMKIDGETLTATPDGSLAVAAYINSGNRLPCKLELGDEIRTYEFGVAPTDMLVLPAEVQTLVDQWRTTMQQSDLMPAKP